RGYWAVYAQKLNADGVPQWTKNGISVCSGVKAGETSPVVCSDNKGGAYVVWKDGRKLSWGTTLYAQQINSDGSLNWKNSTRYPSGTDSGKGIAVVPMS